MDDIDEKIEESFRHWVDEWNLEGMTQKEIYAAGFRDGVREAETEAAKD